HASVSVSSITLTPLPTPPRRSGCTRPPGDRRGAWGVPGRPSPALLRTGPAAPQGCPAPLRGGAASALVQPDRRGGVSTPREGATGAREKNGVLHGPAAEGPRRRRHRCLEGDRAGSGAHPAGRGGAGPRG